jgi:crotonobetainyl-CoA:carnitine CoA-transferase CaiB-like acyl-CoA transferase
MSSVSLSDRRLPLDGVRILDIGVVWAGPYVTQLLAEWGAEIIRIESIQHFQATTRGQVVRPTKEMSAMRGGMGGFPNRDPGARPWNRGPSFNHHARNKKSMTVDLTKPEGQEVFDELVKISDGLVENNVPVSMERVGVTWERISKVNPKFVLLRMPAFGLDGPYKNYRTFGSHMAANVGHYSVMGYRGEDASLTGNTLVADAAGGSGGALAFASGLRYVRKNGKGIFIEIASAENFATYLGDFIVDYVMNGTEPELEGNRHRVLAPQGTYPCRGEDRWITISVADDEEWLALCRTIGRDEMTRDRRFATLEARRENHDALDAEIASWTGQQDATEAMNLLQGAGVAAGAVINEVDAYADPHLADRGFWEPLEHPEIEGGPRLHTGSLWKAERTPRRHGRAAPRLGEDNEYVYKELLGFSDGKYTEFEETGHIGMDYAPHVR